MCLSPSKARHQLALIIQVFLNLLPHVKDGTVSAAEESEGKVLLDMKGCHCSKHTVIVNICSKCTWYRAHPHGGSLDNADTESTGERNAPPVSSGERSVILNQNVG